MGSAAFISVVLVVVDIGFAGEGLELTGGGGGGTVGGDAVVKETAGGRGLVIGLASGTMVTRGITGGKGFISETLSWEGEDGRKAMCLDGEGRDAELTVYWSPKILFENEKESDRVLDLVGDCVWGMTAMSKGFWDVPVSSESLEAWKTLLDC